MTKFTYKVCQTKGNIVCLLSHDKQRMRYVKLIPYEKVGKQRLRYDTPTLLRHKLLHKKVSYKNQLNNMQFALLKCINTNNLNIVCQTNYVKRSQT